MNSKINFIVGGVLVIVLLGGAYYYVQTSRGTASPCASLNAVQKIECERAAAFPQTSKALSSFVALSDAAKLAFDCTSLQDPVAVTECDGNKKYLQMSAELTKGNVGYCEIAFTAALYGARATEYQNECKVSYVLDFTTAKDCSILKDPALTAACMQTKATMPVAKIATTSSTALLAADALFKKAIENKDVSLCGTDSTCKDSYYLQMGQKNIDNALCMKIVAKGPRVTCEYSVALAQAVEHKDVSYCANIEQEALALTCQNEFASGRY